LIILLIIYNMLTHLLLEVGEFTEQANHLFLSSNSSKIDKSSLTLFKHFNDFNNIMHLWNLYLCLCLP